MMPESASYPAFIPCTRQLFLDSRLATFTFFLIRPKWLELCWDVCWLIYLPCPKHGNGTETYFKVAIRE